jgi:L-iditol 2-dehydrogenase
MKALVKYAAGEGNVGILDVPDPICGEKQVKVEVAYCGVCGTDLHVVHDTFRNYPPVILGHELVGKVIEVGRDVIGVTTGTAVAVLGATAVVCGKCQYCISGNFIFCKERRGMGHGVNGAFAKYVVARPDQLYRIPKTLSLEEAALSEPFAVAIHAVTEITDIRIGDTVLISGPGPIGLLCLKLLVSAGIKTIVAGVSGDRERLEAALRIGASAIVDVDEHSLVEAVYEETGGTGVDIALECAGHPNSVRGCLEVLRPMGRYTQVAICGRDIQFPIDKIFYKQLIMKGSICYTANTWDRMMNVYAQGKLRLNDLVSATLPITDWQTGFNLCMQRQVIKVLMYPAE